MAVSENGTTSAKKSSSALVDASGGVLNAEPLQRPAVTVNWIAPLGDRVIVEMDYSKRQTASKVLHEVRNPRDEPIQFGHVRGRGPDVKDARLVEGTKVMLGRYSGLVGPPAYNDQVLLVLHEEEIVSIIDDAAHKAAVDSMLNFEKEEDAGARELIEATRRHMVGKL